MGGNALMRAQYTDLGDDDVIDRGTLAPLVTYRDGRTGVGLPKIVHGPLAAWNRLLAGGYQPGTNDRQGVEDAFEAAGAAMAGGAFATRPAGALASGAARRYRDMATAAEVEPWRVREMLIEDAGRRGSNGPYQAYRGSEHVGIDGAPWGSSNPRVASTYADFGASDTANVMPLEFRFQNPLTVNAQGREFTHIPYRGTTATTDEIAEHAAVLGHDGVIFRQVTDAANGAGIPQTTYHALQRGTTYSPITGELLYANGGKQGASVPLVNGLTDDPMARYHAMRAAAEGIYDDLSAQAGPASARVYRGSKHPETPEKANGYWSSTNSDVANGYAIDVLGEGVTLPYRHAPRPNVTPAETRFSNAMSVDARGANYSDIEIAPGIFSDTERLADAARTRGHDGLVIRNVHDDGPLSDVHYAIKRGTVFSPITGRQIYSRGSPAANLMQQYRGEESPDNALMRYR